MSGVVVTANAGTTWISSRFSPAKISSARNLIGSVTVNGVLFTVIAKVAVNGVGRNGRPNGTSASNT